MGAVLLVVYVLAITGTLPFGRNVRPLFEGIGPPPAYRWVNPPAANASGNVPPKANDTDIPMGSTGSQQSGAQSEDNQLVLNLAPNAVPPHPPDTTLRVHIEPLDPAKLGAVPPDVRPNGNAYRVTMTYEPSGTPATTVTAPGNILLTVPLPAAGLLYSGDSHTWTNIGKQTVAGQPIVGGPFDAVGWYLGATHTQTVSSGGGGGSSGVIIVAVLVGVLALALGFFPLIRRRVRGDQRQPAKKARPVKKAAKKKPR
ncbi:MAG: hypothetical protein JO148_16265 [Acidimicrobiia bacterium]|nr:hypothetical protein [Acidimicrobiia bacterium]